MPSLALYRPAFHILTLATCLALPGCIVIPVSEGVAEKVPLAIPLPRLETGGDPGPAPATAHCPASPDTAASQARILALTNDLRAKNSLPALRAAPALAQVAQAHACDNAARGSYAHEGSDGSTLADRLKRGGYPIRRAAENTGLGFAGSPDKMFAFWQGSPKHRANLLDPGVTHLGLGLAEGAKPTWVLVLAKPR